MNESGEQPQFDETEYFRWKNGEQLDWNKVCFVRALQDPERQLRIINEELTSPALITLSKGGIPRVTVHWTMNHLVASHFGGSWARSGAILVSPGTSLVDRNGVPDNLSAVDSFWAKDMIIPDGSTILWQQDPLTNPSIPKGIEQVQLRVAPKETYEELQRLHDIYLNEDLPYQEVRMPAENKFYSLERNLEDRLNAIVNEELKKGGYPVFYADSKHYMGQPGVDRAVHDLQIREGIKFGNSHVYTSFGGLEIGGGFQSGPLLALSQMPTSLTKNKGSLDDFIEVMHHANRVLSTEYSPDKQLTQGEEKQTAVFSAELFIRLIRSPFLLTNRNVQTLLVQAVKQSESIRNHLLNWAQLLGKDNIEGQKILAIVNKSKFPSVISVE